MHAPRGAASTLTQFALGSAWQVLHSATFSGVPGFAFEPQEDGNGGTFRFDCANRFATSLADSDMG